MPDIYDKVSHGTTTVGIVFKDGVVLATEKRATMGNMISSKTAKKVMKITERIGLTIAGGVGDAQQLARIMNVECSLYEIRRGKEMKVSAAATLLSNYLNNNRIAPYYVQLLVGGVDEGGPCLYSVDALGGASREEDIVATGSGSPFAYGLLEDQFKESMNEKEAVSLATRSLRTAMKRDAASGEGINVVVITGSKFEELPEKDIDKIIAGA